MRTQTLLIVRLTALVIIAGGQTHSSIPIRDIDSVSRERAEKLDQAFSTLVEKHNVITAGVAIIIDGEVAWTGYFGEQSPGIPASQNTQFDAASITKTVTAETILRLIDAGELSLDESMARHWVDPDIEDDPRHTSLSPRMVLNHSTGFLNWRFFSDGNTLHLVNDPGEKYGYSGEGFEYLARFAERKMDVDFESLVQIHTFDPIGMTGVSFSAREANFANIVRAVDEDGAFFGHYCRPHPGWCRQEGEYSAADDMRITVNDYAKFMISVMNAHGYSNEIAAERNRVQVGRDKGMPAIVNCDDVPTTQCPIEQGYGLGWSILDYGENKLVGHGGSDWSEVAQAYFYTHSRDGLIIFLNAPNIRALTAMPEAIELIDPDSPMIGQYRQWLSNVLAGSK